MKNPLKAAGKIIQQGQEEREVRLGSHIAITHYNINRYERDLLINTNY